MRYIRKNKEDAANPIIDDYLDITRNEPWYGAARLYSQFGSFTRKNRLIDDILLPKQEHLYCYCQRRLPDHAHATIEHIIRQSVPNAASMAPYFNFGYPGLNSRNICHTDDYINNRSQDGQYPHKVAYHNFAMACPTCNNARDNQDIAPLFLCPTISDEVDYDRNTSELTWLTDPESIKDTPTAPPTVEKVCLNSPLLKAIRSIWFYGKSHPTETYSTPDTVSNETEK